MPSCATPRLQRVPFALIVGDDDVANGTVGIKTRTGEDTRDVPVPEFVARLEADLAEEAAAGGASE